MNLKQILKHLPAVHRTAGKIFGDLPCCILLSAFKKLTGLTPKEFKKIAASKLLNFSISNYTIHGDIIFVPLEDAHFSYVCNISSSSIIKKSGFRHALFGD